MSWPSSSPKIGSRPERIVAPESGRASWPNGRACGGFVIAGHQADRRGAQAHGRGGRYDTRRGPGIDPAAEQLSLHGSAHVLGPTRL
jgi:hypothetical protein